MANEKFSLKNRLHSFKYAFNGFVILIKEEHNARIHLLASFVVIIAGFCFNLSATEWISILFAMVLVIGMETINSAIENLCDFVSPQKHDLIKKVKDLAAAAVLLSAIGAVIIGLIIFIPKIKALIV